MKSFVKCCAALCAVAAILAMGNSAFADPTGIMYTLQTINGPRTGAGPVLWNNMGSYQTVAGTGLDVDEMVTTLAGGELIGEGFNAAGNSTGQVFAQPGDELLQFWVKTTNGFGVVPNQLNPGGQSDIFFLNLNWPGMPPGNFVADTGFVYFTVNGQPQPMIDVLGLPDVSFFTPTMPGLQVLALGNGADPATAFGISTAPLGAPLQTIFTILGMGNQIETINDIHFGVVVRHVPEPGTWVLCIMGLAGLVPLAIRRRWQEP